MRLFGRPKVIRLFFATYFLCIPFCAVFSVSFAESVAPLDQLTKNAERRFGNLSEAEIELLKQTVSGGTRGMPGSTKDFEDVHKTLEGIADKDDRKIRASIIFWLCTSDEAKCAITASGLWIEEGKICGELDLSDTQIDFPLAFQTCAFEKSLVLSNAKLRSLMLSGCRLPSIEANGVETHSHLEIVKSKVFPAGVSLKGANIGGNLLCTGTTIIASFPRLAIDANQARIGGSVQLDECLNVNGSYDKFSATGKVLFDSATVAGNIGCRGASFINDHGPENPALSLHDTRIGGSLLLFDGSIKGAIHLVGARIAWYLVMSFPAKGNLDVLDLSSARVGTLWDNRQSWPSQGKLIINDFIYDNIYQKAVYQGEQTETTDDPDLAKDRGSQKTRDRVDWLHSQSAFYPQTYEQLARVLDSSGHHTGAKQILCQKQIDSATNYFVRGQADSSAMTFLKNVDNFIKATWWRTRYGFSLPLLLILAVVFVIVDSFIFRVGYSHKLVVPTRPKDAYGDAAHESTEQLELRPDYPPFDWHVFSIETFVPFLRLNVRDHWSTATSREITRPADRPYSFKKALRDDTFILRLYYWIAAALILLTLGFFIAALLRGGVEVVAEFIALVLAILFVVRKKLRTTKFLQSAIPNNPIRFLFYFHVGLGWFLAWLIALSWAALIR